jgi:hypothetical protein
MLVPEFWNGTAWAQSGSGGGTGGQPFLQTLTPQDLTITSPSSIPAYSTLNATGAAGTTATFQLTGLNGSTGASVQFQVNATTDGTIVPTAGWNNAAGFPVVTADGAYTIDISGQTYVRIAVVNASSTGASLTGTVLTMGGVSPMWASNTNAVLRSFVSNYAATLMQTYTRPATASPPPYGTNSAWAPSASGSRFITFTNACRVLGGSVKVTQLLIITNNNPTTKLRGILRLFNAQPTSNIADGAIASPPAFNFNLNIADQTSLAFSVPFTIADVFSTTTAGTGVGPASGADISSLGGQIQCGLSNTNLYGLVQVVNAYQAIASETLTVKLKVNGLN